MADHVYVRLRANKRDGESFSDPVEQLIGSRSLCDFREVFDGEQLAEMCETINTADEQNRGEVADRFE